MHFMPLIVSKCGPLVHNSDGACVPVTSCPCTRRFCSQSNTLLLHSPLQRSNSDTLLLHYCKPPPLYIAAHHELVQAASAHHVALSEVVDSCHAHNSVQQLLLHPVAHSEPVQAASLSATRKAERRRATIRTGPPTPAPCAQSLRAQPHLLLLKKFIGLLHALGLRLSSRQ
jgi:hypothetical protein